jgi:transcriptional regulator with XRE-family HTH domain
VHTLSDLESGKGNPTLEVLSRVCGVLGLEIRLSPREIAGFVPANTDDGTTNE